MCAKLANVSAPKVDELTDSDSKDKLLAAVRSSFDFCSSSLANTDDSNLGDPIEFFGRQGPRAMAAFILIAWVEREIEESLGPDFCSQRADDSKRRNRHDPFRWNRQLVTGGLRVIKPKRGGAARV